MKKFGLSVLSILLLNLNGWLYAENEVALEFRSSAFFHSNSKFRDIYGVADPAFGIELSKKFCCNYQAWVDVDYSYSNTDSQCCRTDFKVLNTSFGINCVYSLGCSWDAYAGIGPAISWVKLKNETCCGRERFSRCAVGGVLKTGLYYHFCNNFFIDIFADYLYQPVNLGNSIDIGGLKLGAGIGTRF